MRKFGLIGYPLSHSFSKQYFTDKFARESIIDSSYENYPIEKIELLPGLIEREKDIIGLNVTIPYKKDVLKYLSETEHDAAMTGAVNTIKIVTDRGKKLFKGYNTDIFGFRESLIPYLKSDSYNALILGTGGSSLAVRFVLTSLGIKYLAVSRDPLPGDLKYSDVSDRIIIENTLIINTTPLGMYPDNESFPDINYEALTRNHILYDLIYNPGMTKFLIKGKERGCTVIGGLKMLHLQAERSWSIWNDHNL